MLVGVVDRVVGVRFLLAVVVALIVVSCGAGEVACTDDSASRDDQAFDLGVDEQQIMLDVMYTGETGFLAVGSDGPSKADDAAVWTSDDGVGWVRVSHSDSVFGGGGQQKMFDITEGGPGFVAVGWDRPGDDRDAAVWTSTDQIAWCRVPHVESVFGGSEWQTMLAVTEGGPGLVAVGWDVTDDDQDAAVWTSVDGVTWTRVDHDETLFGGEFTKLTGASSQLMWDVTRADDGLVAVGANKTGWPYHAVAWTSSNGTDWKRHDVDLDNEEIGGSMLAVTAGGPGFVAVGEEFNSQGKGAAVWVSKDGVDWARIASHESVFHERLGNGYAYSMMDVTLGESGFVAVGSEGYTSEEDAAVWTSPDGLTWTKVPRDESVFGGSGLQIMTAVSYGDSGFVAVGQHSVNNEWDAAIWTSTDGVTWSRVTSD